jgi:competence protein ComEC
MFIYALSLLAGHCVVHFGVARLPSIETYAYWGIALLVAAILASLSKRTRWLAAFLCGIAWSSGHAVYRLSHDLTASQPRTDVVLEGYIASIVEREAFGQRFVFDIESLDSDIELKRVELTWYDAPVTVQPGEKWRVHARLRPRQGFANPGGYDYEAQLFREGVNATGYVRNGDNLRLAAASWRYGVLQARNFIAQRLAAALPDTSMLGIVQGLAIGETQAMSADQWRVFAHTGTTHLMAISGLHIAMVAMLFAWLTRALARRLPLQRWNVSVVSFECAGGMSAALIYSLLAGLSVPTQRTLVMLCVYFGMRWRRREVATLHGFGLALIAVLMVDPFAPLAAGFWLSFGAVAAIVAGMGGRVARGSRGSEYLRMQAVVTGGMAPLTIGAFGSVSLIAPFANLLAIPLFTLLLVPAILAGSALASLHVSLGAPLLQGIAWMLEQSWPLWVWAADVPLALWRVPQLPWLEAALFCAGCALCIAPSAWMLRVAGLALCVPAIVWSPPRPAFGQFELAMLDVGQGLSVVVTTQRHVLVYDAGPAFRSGRDTGELVVLPYLYAQGVRHIDMFVASHGDVDHVGGMRSVVAGLPTRRVLAGSSVKTPPSPQTSFEHCKAGQSWRWDGVEFAVLYPEEPESMHANRKDNDTSCVLTIRSAYGSATIFGDVERYGEQQMIERRRIQATDIAVVPHHGSRTSSTPALVSALQARIALVGAGAGNRWGFPKPDVLARWQVHGADTFVTSTAGAIRVSVGAQGVAPPRLYRLERRRYWQPVPQVAAPAQSGFAAQAAGESW